MFGIDAALWRGGLLVALVVGGLIAWWRGERHLRGIHPAKGWESLTATAVMLWRTVMFTLGAVAVVAAIGLWWAQDASVDSQVASEDADTAAQSASETARALCLNTLGWQDAALANRQADVRIVESELRIAERELDDAERLLDDAQVIVEEDGQESPTEAFFLGGFRRDVARADTKVNELTEERERRVRSAGLLEVTRLEGCPPDPVAD